MALNSKHKIIYFHWITINGLVKTGFKEKRDARILFIMIRNWRYGLISLDYSGSVSHAAFNNVRACVRPMNVTGLDCISWLKRTHSRSSTWPIHATTMCSSMSMTLLNNTTLPFDTHMSSVNLTRYAAYVKAPCTDRSVVSGTKTSSRYYRPQSDGDTLLPVYCCNAR